MLTITKQSDTAIKVQTDVINIAWSSTAPEYSNITVIGKINCCGTEKIVVRTLPLTTPGPDTQLKVTGLDTLEVYPAFFGLTQFKDGVFSFEVKGTKKNNLGFITEANCAFMDFTYKCKVAATLEGLVQESQDNSIEPIGTMVHLLHYGLINGSNCQHNCEDLCKAFKELTRLLTGITPQITDCGC